MRHLRGHFAALEQIDDARAIILALQYEIDFLTHVLRPAELIGVQRIFKIPETLGGVVEIGQNLVKLRRVELREQVGEVAERHGALIKMLGLFHHLIGDGVGDEYVNSEITAAFLVVNIGRARFRIHQGKAFAVGIAAAAAYLLDVYKRQTLMLEAPCKVLLQPFFA